MALQKKKDHDATTVLAATTTAAGAVSTSGSAVRLPGMVNAIAFVLNVTAAATDAVDTLDVKVQTKLDGTNWVDVVSFTQVLGNGGALKHIAKIEAGTAQAMFADAVLAAGSTRNLLGDEWRVTYVQVDADSDASFTFSVIACPM
jgi:lipopolysaccharide biosynthesis protein